MEISTLEMLLQANESPGIIRNSRVHRSVVLFFFYVLALNISNECFVINLARANEQWMEILISEGILLHDVNPSLYVRDHECARTLDQVGNHATKEPI